MNKITNKINELIQYALFNNLLGVEDVDYAINKICDLIGFNDFENQDVITNTIPNEPSEILQSLLDYASKQGLINPDTITRRDIFEAKIMDIVIPRPSEIITEFKRFNNSEEATNYYYNLSQKSNYIKTARTNKNVIWKSTTKYGVLDMTINLSKPEKDPRDIIAAGKKTTNKYPKCLLCKENVGYNGQSTNIGRTSHRIIPVTINEEAFYLQYSPYVYYNEHCIVLKKEHDPMNVTINTFRRLFDFVDQFPHYFLGSNAGLPIVGGSILSHEHYQGGKHHFAIEDAKVLHSFQKDDVTFSQIYWPLSVIRLSSTNREAIIKYADKLFTYWENYSNIPLGIHSHTDATPHNAITPIARKKDDTYYLDMTLRNNRTSTDFPLGIFHPHTENHHIKKENIGLIEVMGLAVLPARLATELPLIKEAVQNNTTLPKEIALHSAWLKELKTSYKGENIDEFINNQVAIKFMKVIENAGVFKQTLDGQNAFKHFMEELEHGIDK